MSQDVVADGLNMIKNAKRARKSEIKINRFSNLLVEILKIMKSEGAIKKYKIDTRDKNLTIVLGDFTDCKSVKPRFSCNADQIEKYRRRYLPARGIGVVIISTNKGLMTHEEAQENKIGGSVIAYFY